MALLNTEPRKRMRVRRKKKKGLRVDQWSKAGIEFKALLTGNAVGSVNETAAAHIGRNPQV
jgi:hypothetical protein